ncbi:hypothetical protein NNJEOMEG_00240 [Fundidesulfovibrio magnetotacticus]|uniref:Uncharacterized protein n=1 Tax=Fundidesulfovibrio magnetotacticus TaxID=2730080 RepID=A0A6V8LVX6_9BACT|nr:hypothetical protein [Fundidesulfovibrio magnetotacticus]GFK92415.1 hypothetical protein NNJEOMEG_00240 [Fundidesulfovibrio magnetotacticus]
MPEREKFGVQMEEQLERLREKIDKVKTKAEARGEGSIGKFEEKLSRLESKYDLARYKLTLLRKGGGSAWGELKEGFENAFHELKDALSKAKGKF